MREAAYSALLRYDAMAGRLEGIPDSAARQAAADRERFGATYLTGDKDLWNPLLTIRFMAEVCGIPLQESRDAVLEHWRETRAPSPDAPTMVPAQQAHELLATLGDIFAAREFALLAVDLLAGEEPMAGFWREVVRCIERTALVPEDLGAEWD